MANNIKGITVEIGGNTGPLTSALKDVNKTAGDLQGELNQVNRQLKFDPKNVDLLRQKEELTSQTTQALKEKQAILKEAVEQAHAAFEKGDLGADKVRAVEREYAKVTSQINDLENKAGKTSFFSKIADKLNITKENIKTALGTIGIAVGTFLGSSIKEAAEAGNAQANLEQTVKSTGGAAGLTAKQMEELAQKEMSVSTFSKDEIESGEGMLATFTKIGKDVFPQATQAVLDFAQKMGTSPKQAALTLGKALNDPATGLTKLTRAGVTFTAQQKEQIVAMEKAGNTAGAQKLMIEELNREFGGQASAAADTFSGKQKQLANEFKEVKESIGNALLPVLAELGSYLVKILGPIASFISQHPKITAAILATIAIVGTLIGGMSVLNTVTSTFGITLDAALLPTIGLVVAAIAAVVAGAALIITHWSGIKAFFIGLWTGVKSTTESVWNEIKTFFVNIWNGIKTAVMAIATPFINGITNLFDNMKSGLTTIMTGLKEYFSGIWLAIKTVTMGPILLILDLVTGNFTKLSTDAQGIFNNLKTAFSNIWNGIKTIFKGAVQTIAGFLKTEFNGIKNTITTIWNGIKSFFSTVWSGITSVIKNAWNGIVKFLSNPAAISNAIKSAWNAAINWIKKLPHEALQWGKDIIQGLINGIKSMISAVGNAVKSVADKIRSFLHFSRPDEGPLKDYESWMPDFIEGLAKGIENNKSKIQQAVQGLSTDISIGAKYMPAYAGANIANSDSSTGNNSSIGALLHVDKVVINNDSDIQTLANKLEFYREQAAAAKGGKK